MLESRATTHTTRFFNAQTLPGTVLLCVFALSMVVSRPDEGGRDRERREEERETGQERESERECVREERRESTGKKWRKTSGEDRTQSGSKSADARIWYQ